MAGSERPAPTQRASCHAQQRQRVDEGATGDEDWGNSLPHSRDPCHSPAAPYTPATFWRYEAANAMVRRELGRAESGLQATSGMLSVRPQMPPELFRDERPLMEDGGCRRSFA